MNKMATFEGWFYTKGVILELDEGGETVDE